MPRTAAGQMARPLLLSHVTGGATRLQRRQPASRSVVPATVRGDVLTVVRVVQTAGNVHPHP